MAHVTLIEYSQLVSTGDYGNIKVGIVVALDPGDNVKKAFDNAKRAVRSELDQGETPKPSDEELNYAKAIVERCEGLSDDGDYIF